MDAPPPLITGRPILLASFLCLICACVRSMSAIFLFCLLRSTCCYLLVRFSTPSFHRLTNPRLLLSSHCFAVLMVHIVHIQRIGAGHSMLMTLHIHRDQLLRLHACRRFASLTSVGNSRRIRTALASDNARINSIPVVEAISER